MKNAPWIFVAFVALVGCKPSSPKFMEEVVQVDCDYRVACYDAAVLEFYNWGDRQTCTRASTADWSDRIAGCDYDKKAAKQCLKDLEALVEEGTCLDGDPPAYPDSCLVVGTECADLADTDVPENEDSGAAE